jgi:subtilisin family serine protease
MKSLNTGAAAAKTAVGTKPLTALAAAVAVTLAGAAGAASARLDPPPSFATAGGRLAASQSHGRVDVFVTLEGTPASVAYARSFARGGKGLVARSAAGQVSRGVVSTNRAAQVRFADRLAGSGIAATELYRVSRVLNGVALNVDAGDIAALGRLPGVVSVRPLPQHKPSLSTSVPFINAPQLWEGTPLATAGADGTGVRIGIIDSGIDYQHPMFGGSGLLADYQANDRTVISDTIGGVPSFPTAKVVGGTDFAGDDYNAGTTATSTPHPDPDPMDCGGHGTHVAGIAGGLGVRDDGTPFAGPWNTGTDFAGLRIGPGVAPGAELYALRVFGCGGTTTLTIKALDWAQDPNGDDDVSDHLDVVNLSLGSSFGQPDDDTSLAADNAVETGMIVVISAGNDGDTYFVNGSPAASRHAISVANTIDSGVSGPVVVNAPEALAGIKTTGAALFGPTVPPAGVTAAVVAVDDGSTETVPPGGTPAGTAQDGCQTPFANAAAVQGRIAFIDRGGCAFKLKAYNAQLNGAVGAIIGNVAASGNAGQVTGMSDDTTIPQVTIPSANLALADADAFRAGLAGGIDVTLSNGADTVSASTSRGPSGVPGQAILKPDLSAPGTNIESALTGVICTGPSDDPPAGCVGADPSGYTAAGRSLRLSGTSMAAPHVAGLVALLRQQNPEASVAQIKAIAMNSARHALTTGPNGTLDVHGASRTGAGRIDAAASASPIVAFNDASPELVSLTFDDDVVDAADVTRDIRLENRTSTARTVDLALSTRLDSPGVAFSLAGATSQVAVPAGGSVLVPVRMVATGSQMKRYRDPSVSATQTGSSDTAVEIGALPREYIAEESADLIVSSAGQEVARVPVYMAHRPHSRLSGRLGGDDAQLSLEIAGTGLCTGTLEGTDCETEADDRQSTVSVLELQYTGTRHADDVRASQEIRYLGATYADDRFVFGLATFGPWSTANAQSINVCVDTDRDGEYDRVLFTTTPGDYATLIDDKSNDPMDVYVTGMFTPPENLRLVSQPNFSAPDRRDGDLFDGNTLLIGATAANLGLADGERKLDYAVAVCPSFNHLCARIDRDPTQCGTANGTHSRVPGPFTYDGNAPGFVIPVTDGGPAALLFEQDGSVIHGTLDAANLAANGASGLLLLHHANLPEEAAQVIGFDRIFADGFEPGAD